MDFTQYAQGQSQTPTIAQNPSTSKPQNYDHITDPYIRRYHITKIALQSLSYGILAHLSKTLIENMYKFVLLSIEVGGDSMGCRHGWRSV